jgi:ankyrin repeat protein
MLDYLNDDVLMHILTYLEPGDIVNAWRAQPLALASPIKKLRESKLPVHMDLYIKVYLKIFHKVSLEDGISNMIRMRHLETLKVVREVAPTCCSDVLFNSCLDGDKEIAETLMNMDVSLHPRALLVASKSGHPEIVKLLLHKGERLTDPTYSILPEVIYKGGSEGGSAHREVAELLIKAGTDVHDWEDMAIRVACEAGLTSIVKMLIDAGANVDASNGSPLKGAVEGGYTSIVKMLIDAGADVELCADRRESPIIYASEAGHLEIVRLLLDAGVDVDYPATPSTWGSSFSYNPLCCAAGKGMTEVCRLLLERGADIHAYHELPLKRALRCAGCISTVELLLDKGATFLEYMIDIQCNVEIGRILVRRGLMSPSGLLKRASEADNLPLVRLSLEQGAWRDRATRENVVRFSTFKGNAEIADLVSSYTPHLSSYTPHLSSYTPH